MKIFIDCSKILTRKMASKVTCYVDDIPVLEGILNAKELAFFSLDCKDGSIVRLHLSTTISQKMEKTPLLEYCTYEEFEKNNNTRLPSKFYSNVELAKEEKFFDGINFIREWIYAYDSSFVYDSSSMKNVVFFITDKYIHDEMQIADICCPEGISLVLTRVYSGKQIEQQYKKKSLFYLFRYAVVTVISICAIQLIGALYYTFFSTIASGSPEGLIIMISLLILGYIRWNHKNLKRASQKLKNTDQVFLSEEIRNKIKNKQSLPKFCKFLDEIDKKMKK